VTGVQTCALPILGIEKEDGGYRLTLSEGGRTESFTSEYLVNAAGLGSDTVAALAGIDVDSAGYRLHYCKGSYFALAPAKSNIVSRLVYPVPAVDSLGVHAVVDLAGRVRFGPDVEYLKERRQDYRVDEARLTSFGEAVRRLIPAISNEDLSPDISGIRAKLQGEDQAFRDFVIVEEKNRGLLGLVNLIGIDSPGLTSAPAIAEYVARLFA